MRSDIESFLFSYSESSNKCSSEKRAYENSSGSFTSALDKKG